MSSAEKRAPLRWSQSTPVIWVLGVPHFVPLLGVYALLAGTSVQTGRFLMLGALAATGCIAGLAQALRVGPLALLVTPVSFLLGYAPGPLLIFRSSSGHGSPRWGIALLLTFMTSIFCITAGQMLLAYWSERD